MSQLIAERYQLDREIGRGGMGAVWLAQDTILGRSVALKQIGMLPGADQADLDRVEREARVSAMLHHEHVVSVFDLVSDGDRHWLVMEYVESRTLAELIRDEGALAPDQVADVVGQAAVALGAAHRAGIVHRDVKPSNILVTPEGRVKLGDFGIARTSSDPTLTQTGLVTGSPSYLAPEVATGKPATEASDMWSLGATIYHAVAGHPPYDARGNLMGALYRIVHEEPPTTDRAGWLTPLLAATMHRDPESRWSADQVSAFLRNGPGEDQTTQVVPAAAPVVVPAPPPSEPPASGHTQVFAEPSRDRRRLPFPAGLVAGIAAAIVLLVLVAWLASRDPGPAEPPAADDSPSASPDDPPPDDEPEQPTEEGMTQFVENYLDDVTEDPAVTWPRLTPAFQQESGGFGSYAGFWGQFESADVEEISADAEQLTVSYTVEYTPRGDDDDDEVVDDVVLELVFEDGEYLIAGEQ